MDKWVRLVSMTVLMLMIGSWSVSHAQNLSQDRTAMSWADQQSMLSQRIALLYATQTQFGQAGDIGMQYQQAIQSFVRGMKRLESFQGHSPRIKQTIAAVQTRWRFTEYVFQQPRSLARVVDVNCEQLLNDLNAITSAYVVMDVR